MLLSAAYSDAVKQIKRSATTTKNAIASRATQIPIDLKLRAIVVLEEGGELSSLSVVEEVGGQVANAQLARRRERSEWREEELKAIVREPLLRLLSVAITEIANHNCEPDEVCFWRSFPHLLRGFSQTRTLASVGGIT